MNQHNTNECSASVTDYKHRLFNYIVIGLLVGVIAKWVASHKLTKEEIGIIAISASTIFMVLDIYTPSVKCTGDIVVQEES